MAPTWPRPPRCPDGSTRGGGKDPVLPTCPASIAPALTASSIGGPEVNVDHCTWYGMSSSTPAARNSSRWLVPFWSPMRRVTLASCSGPDHNQLTTPHRRRGSQQHGRPMLPPQLGDQVVHRTPG